MSEVAPERRPWPPMLTLGLVAVVLVGVPWGFKLATAERLGEPCEGGFDCEALDGRCVMGEHGRFCTVTCEEDSECPSSGHCGVPPHDEWQRWFSASVVSERFCVPGARPEGEAGVVAMPSVEGPSKPD